MLSAIGQDVRYALRALGASRGLAAVAILSLALGIGANTAIFSLIDAVMLKALPVSHPEELLQVAIGSGAGFGNPIWEQLRDRQDVFSGIFAYGTIFSTGRRQPSAPTRAKVAAMAPRRPRRLRNSASSSGGVLTWPAGNSGSASTDGGRAA